MQPSLLKATLEKHDMNMARAARELGVTRQAIRQQVRKHFDCVKVLMPKKVRGGRIR